MTDPERRVDFSVKMLVLCMLSFVPLLLCQFGVLTVACLV